MTHNQFLIAFAALNLLDVLTTVAALKRKGLKEANPVMRHVMDKIGTLPALLLIKAAVMAFFLYVQVPIEMQVLMLVIYAAVVLNNVRLIRKL